MLFKIHLDSYKFSPNSTSTGKLNFQLEEIIFPEEKSNNLFAIDQVLMNWMEVITHLVQSTEIGLYFFDFEDESHKWVVDYEGDDDDIVIQFLKNEKLVYFMQSTIEDLIDAILFEVELFLEHCAKEEYLNEQITELKKSFLNLIS